MISAVKVDGPSLSEQVAVDEFTDDEETTDLDDEEEENDDIAGDSHRATVVKEAHASIEKEHLTGAHSISEVSNKLELIHKFRLKLSEVDPIGCKLFTDSYLWSVYDKYNPHTGKMRTFEYALEKLAKALRWRIESGVSSIKIDAETQQVILPEAVLNIIRHENYMYWRGYDIHNRPILWTINSRIDYHRRSADLSADILYYACMLELGIYLLPPGVNTFLLVSADNRGVSFKNGPKLRDFKEISNVLTTGYPDRCGKMVIVANRAYRILYKMLKPFLPSNLIHKMTVTKQSHCKEELLKFVSAAELPSFCGGTMRHDDIRDATLMFQVQREMLHQLMSSNARATPREAALTMTFSDQESGSDEASTDDELTDSDN